MATLALAAFLILYALDAFGVAIPVIILGIVALIAGILFLVDGVETPFRLRR